MTDHRARLAMVMLAIVPLAACGGDDRPTADEWAATWQARQALVPERSVLEGDDASDVCGTTVGTMRTQFPDLTPTPDAAMQSAVDEWVAHAETIAFECSDDPDQLDRQYDELATLAAEVDAALAESRG